MRSVGWSFARASVVFGFFLLVDMTFLASNLLKVADGGWFPILVAAIAFTIMATWWRGRRMLADLRTRDSLPLQPFIDSLKPDHPIRVPGSAIVMAREVGRVPLALLHALKHYKVLHERTALMTVQTEDIPHVSDEQRLEIHDLGKGFHTIRVRYGFMDQPNILRALAQCRRQDLRFPIMETSFIIGRQKLLASKRHTALARWRKQLFIVMSNNMLDATEFFRIPPNRVVELGGQIEI
jgi:KUP system potassium uptake protein